MKYINELLMRYPKLEVIRNDIELAYIMLLEMYKSDGTLLVGGNGGSCSDAGHIVGELMKGFCRKRELSLSLKQKLEKLDYDFGKKLSSGLQYGLRAIDITGHTSLTTAFANDVDADMTYAQQVNGYGRKGDILWAISTSGNAKNLMYAAITAKAKDMKVILLSGKTGGMLAKIADVSIIVPDDETYRIQELHLPIYHALCLELENYFFGNPE